MGFIDPRVDAYISKAQPFAKPVLDHLRAVIHAANPEIAEAIKWGMPAFLYKGKILAGMASFKAHATFGVWGRHGMDALGKASEAMGDVGRLTGLDDLPDAARLKEMLDHAIAVIDAGVSRQPKRAAKPTLDIPPPFAAALDAKPGARATFDGFPPSAQREYKMWVTEAKREETRDKRIAQAVEWIAEGKRRNWKYENC